MNKKRYILVVTIILIGIVILIVLNNKLDNKETILDEVKLKENKVDKNSFAIMIQKEDGSGYDVYGENTWPTEGYEFNSELSGCIDNYGSLVENSMTYNKDTNIITIDTGVTSSCYVYFDIVSNYLSETIMSLTSISGSNVYNEGDAGYRYEGAEVNNYITFNNETWRIIGVEEGSKIGLTSGEYYTKIIREYDSSTDSTLFSLMYDSDRNHGNDWSTTSLYTLLNGDYYNRSGSYASVGLTPEAKGLMVDANWYYTPIGSEYEEYTTSAWYTNERSDATKVVKDAVGIMYPSDYGYAATQSFCGSIGLNYYDGYEQDVVCYEHDWLYVDIDQWTIIPFSASTTSAFYVNFGGCVVYHNVNLAFAVRPVVYLDSDVVITNDGDGSVGSKFEVGK